MYKLSLILVSLILIGFITQYILTRLDDIKYPPLGKMLDIGGYKLHIHIMGEHHNGPTVVLDMGLGGGVLYWSKVQPEIAKFAKVISYDRAGIGWSERSPLPRTSENIVLELQKLLHKAGIHGPYILVGHSFSGINARVFANKYPNEVAGVILVDSSHENQLQLLPKPRNLLSKMIDFPTFHPFLLFSSSISLVRAFHLYNDDSDKFDKKLRRIIRAKNSSDKFMKTFLEECRSFERNLSEVRAKGYNLGDIFLVVVSAGVLPSKEACAKHGHAFPEVCNKAYNVWQSLQKDLVTKSTNSKQIIAYNSGHIVPEDEPQVIVEAVREMIMTRLPTVPRHDGDTTSYQHNHP